MKHEITIHENTGATKEVAPYLGSYISKETVHEYTFAAALAEKCGLPAIQVMAILDGVFTEIERMEQESLVRVHLDGFTVCGVIRGSFPSADAPFDPARNSLELALRLDEDIKLDLADVTPTIISDLKVTKLRVDNVMDLASPKPYNVIHGTDVFRVAGYNMVLDDEGAEAFLLSALGQTFALTVDEVVSKQLFKAHVTGVPAGDYKLVVKSRAGDAEGPLQTSFRKVKVLAPVVPPAPTATIDEIGQSADGGGVDVPDRWNREESIMAKGANLFFDPEMGDKIEFKYFYGSEVVTCELAEGTYELAADHGSVYILSEAYPTTLEAGIDLDVIFTTHAGVAGSPAQTITKTLTYNEP